MGSLSPPVGFQNRDSAPTSGVEKERNGPVGDRVGDRMNEDEKIENLEGFDWLAGADSYSLKEMAPSYRHALLDALNPDSYSLKEMAPSYRHALLDALNPDSYSLKEMAPSYRHALLDALNPDSYSLKEDGAVKLEDMTVEDLQP